MTAQNYPAGDKIPVRQAYQAPGSRESKVPRTRRQECLRYNAVVPREAGKWLWEFLHLKKSRGWFGLCQILFVDAVCAERAPHNMGQGI